MTWSAPDREGSSKAEGCVGRPQERAARGHAGTPGTRGDPPSCERGTRHFPACTLCLYH